MYSTQLSGEYKYVCIAVIMRVLYGGLVERTQINENNVWIWWIVDNWSAQHNIRTDDSVLEVYGETLGLNWKSTSDCIYTSLYSNTDLKHNKDITLIHQIIIFERCDSALYCELPSTVLSSVRVCVRVSPLDVVHILQILHFQTFNYVFQEFCFRGQLNSRLRAIHKRKKMTVRRNLFMLQLLLWQIYVHSRGPVRIMHSWIMATLMPFVTGVWIARVHVHCGIKIIMWRFE